MDLSGRIDQAAGPGSGRLLMSRCGIALIDAVTGFNRWSHTFDRALSDIFALQSEVAEMVVKRISAQLSPPHTDVGGTTSLTAFEAYLRGMGLYRSDAGEQSDRQALSSFDAAIAADPNYAAAHAARANSLTLIAQQYARAEALEGMYAQAESEAQRAIALAPDFPGAYVALANLQFSGRLNIQGARELTKELCRAAPGMRLSCRQWLFSMHRRVGRQRRQRLSNELCCSTH